jgi:RNHCP domain
MVFIARQEPFDCENCRTPVQPLPQGSYRNHCPKCLCSKHVDAAGPGDRASTCGGVMDPISLDYKGSKGWIVVHECRKCGKMIPNITAPDDDLVTFQKRLNSEF